MVCKNLVVWWALVALLAIHATPSFAGGLRSRHAFQRERLIVRAAQGPEKPGEFARATQIDGRSTWDLGNHLGQWPTTR